jgi:hypothetical protein
MLDAVVVEIPGHPLDDLPSLESGEQIVGDGSNAAGSTEEVPRDGAGAVAVAAVVDGEVHTGAEILGH